MTPVEFAAALKAAETRARCGRLIVEDWRLFAKVVQRWDTAEYPESGPIADAWHRCDAIMRLEKRRIAKERRAILAELLLLNAEIDGLNPEPMTPLAPYEQGVLDAWLGGEDPPAEPPPPPTVDPVKIRAAIEARTVVPFAPYKATDA